MKLLLDTHILIWAADSSQKLSPEARALLNNPENELYFSPASLWEITIKNALGHDDFHVEARLLRRGLLDNGYLELPISSEHAVGTDVLPEHHKDPFDRILVSQALSEGFTFVTADSRLSKYPGSVRIV